MDRQILSFVKSLSTEDVREMATMSPEQVNLYLMLTQRVTPQQAAQAQEPRSLEVRTGKDLQEIQEQYNIGNSELARAYGCYPNNFYYIHRSKNLRSDTRVRLRAALETILSERQDRLSTQIRSY